MCLKSNISKSTPSNGDTFVHLKTLEESKATLSEVPYCCLFHSVTVVMSETWSTYLETLLGLFYPPGEREALWTNFVSAGRLNRQDFPGSFDWSSVSDASGHSEHIVLPHGFGNPIWLELGSRKGYEGFFIPTSIYLWKSWQCSRVCSNGVKGKKNTLSRMEKQGSRIYSIHTQRYHQKRLIFSVFNDKQILRLHTV